MPNDDSIDSVKSILSNFKVSDLRDKSDIKRFEEQRLSMVRKIEFLLSHLKL